MLVADCKKQVALKRRLGRWACPRFFIAATRAGASLPPYLYFGVNRNSQSTHSELRNPIPKSLGPAFASSRKRGDLNTETVQPWGGYVCIRVLNNL
jgi:hypothetical protein